MDKFIIRNTWLVTETGYKHGLNRFYIEGVTDKKYHGFIYPHNQKIADNLKKELQAGTFDILDYFVEWD